VSTGLDQVPAGDSGSNTFFNTSEIGVGVQRRSRAVEQGARSAKIST